MQLNKFSNCFFILFFSIISGFVQANGGAASGSSEDLPTTAMFKDLNDESNKMNALIARYEANNSSLSEVDQKNYADTLIAFKIGMRTIADQGIDVETYNKNYTDGYVAWAQLMITEQSLLDEIAKAGTEPSEDPWQKKVNELYNALYSSIDIVQDKFQTQVSAILSSLGAYSSTSQKEFLNLLHDAFKSFTTSVNSKRTFIKNQFYANLDPSADPDNLSDEDKDFLNNVDVLTKNAIACQRAFMLDITSKAVKENMITKLNKAFKISQLENANIYQDTLIANEKGLDASWWSELKDSGADLLKDFSVEFKKEFLRQTKLAIARQAEKIVGYIGGDILYPISQSLDQQLAKLSTQLLGESASGFLKDSTSAVRALKLAIQIANPVLAPTSPVSVSVTTDLSAAEKIFVKNRWKKIQPILQDEFEISEPLCMAFCCSGGGNRAMIGSMGIFQAAVKAKILQSSMYMAGLSGSTWLIAPWSYLYLQDKLSKDFEVGLQQMVQNWNTVLNNPKMISAASGNYLPAPLTGSQATTFSYQIAKFLAYDEPFSIVDLYGAMIGNFALDLAGNDRLNVTWSSVAQKLQLGDIPMPLCSSVFDIFAETPTRSGEHRPYGWFEFSPWQAGGTELGYVPMQYLGSTFINGALDGSLGQLRPAYPLHFILGVCGSAFAVSTDDLIDKGLPIPKFRVGDNEISIPIDTWMRAVIDAAKKGPDARGKRLNAMHAQFLNFSMDLSTSILKNKEHFALIDAGINFNFPLPVLLDRPSRNVDLIFIYDSNPGDYQSFLDAAVYYQRMDTISVPEMSGVTEKSLMAKVMTVFNDPRESDYDAKQPSFLYFPTRGFDIKKAPYVTLNFKYTPDQMEALINAMDEAFTSQVPEIKKIMKLVATARHPNG